MNEVIQQIKKSRNLQLFTIIITLVLVLTGETFAYFAFSASNTAITGNAGTVQLTLNVTKVLPNKTGIDNVLVINFNELAASLNSDCVDSDGEFTLCQLYRVNLANAAGGVNTRVKGSVSFNNATAPNLSWLLLGNSYSSSTTYTSAQLGNTINTASSNFASFVDNYVLEAGSNVDFYILVWVNETEDEQTDEGTYSGIVRFEDANGKGVTSMFNI